MVRFRRGREEDSAARLRSALLALLDGAPQDAVSALEAIVQADSDDFEVYLALAHLYRQQGESGRALRLHQNLLMRGDLPASLRARAQRGLADDLRAGGHRDRAIAAYQEALQHEPSNARADAALSELLEEGGHYDRALARLGGGFFRRSDDPLREAQLRVMQARAEHEQGHIEAARKMLKRAIRTAPELAEARVALGEIEAERGKDKAALAAWRAAIALEFSASDRLWEKIASACAALGRPAELEKLVRDRLAGAPEDGAARRALAHLLVARNDVEEALAELRLALERAPGDLETRAQIGRTLLGEGREADAAKELGELLEVLVPSGPTAGPTAGTPKTGSGGFP